MKIAYIKNMGAVSEIKIKTRISEKEILICQCYIPTEDLQKYCLLNKVDKFYVK